MKKVISIPVIRRLPRYLRKLDELDEKGVARISSFQLSEMLGLTASQVRQDFSCFGEFGQQGYGFDIKNLRAEIAGILGMNRGYKAILVGVGNIGRALTEKFSFNEWGFELVCAFDTDPHVVGTVQNGVAVLHAHDIPSYLKENKIDVAVLAVSKESARNQWQSY